MAEKLLSVYSLLSKPIEFDGFRKQVVQLLPDAEDFDLRRYFFPPTLTSTIVIVSLPKMSTTLTASLRRPGPGSAEK
jgi:hypothetical protein